MAQVIANSRDYWREREETQREKNITDQQEYNAEIEKIYNRVFDNIQKEIDHFYQQYAGIDGITMAEAKRRASKLDMEEYSRKAERYVERKDFSKTANDEMRLYNMTMKVNRLELLKAKLGLELVDGFDDLEKYFGQKLDARTMEEFERQAGILGESVKNANFKAQAIVNASFHNARFSDRIWMHQDILKHEMERLLSIGLIQGRNPKVLARDIRNRFGVSMHAAQRLMQTELARVQTEAQRQSFDRNGYKKYMYICCTKGDACEICRALDGEIFEVKGMQIGENAPPMHPYCHCSTAAYVDLDNSIKIRSTSSPKSLERSLDSIRHGKAGLTKAREKILERVPDVGDEERFQRDKLSIHDLAYLTAATGHEFALFRGKNEDILIHGDMRRCDPSPVLERKLIDRGYTWIAHSHVDMGLLVPSKDDRRTLEILGQKKSIIIGPNGRQIEFGRSEFS